MFYRDDSLAIIRKANGPKMEKIKKLTIALFKSERIFVTIDINLIERDFLDVSFNLEMEKLRDGKAEQQLSLHPF